MDQPTADLAAPLWTDDGSALGPEEIVELDRLAPEVLRRGLPSRLVGQVDALRRTDLEGHPWTQLLTAAVCHDARRGDPCAVESFQRAWDAFAAAGDQEAMGVAANVRANIALGHGDIPSAVAWWRRAEHLLGEPGDIAIGAAAHGSLEAYAKGDLVGAEQRAREALLMADAGGDPGDSLVPLIYLGLYAFCLGDLERSSEIYRTAAAIAESLSEVRNEQALVEGFTGVIAALRGHQAEADRRFARALTMAEVEQLPWYALMIRSLRAEYTAQWAPHRSLVDARRAQREADALGDAWWHGLARYAEGAALAELGDFEGARSVLEDAIGELTNPIERAFAQLELGEVLLCLSDRPGAREVLEEARQAFEACGGRYWATRASLAMGAADRSRGGRWLRLARSTAAADPAYERLFAPSQALEIKVLGPPAVLLDGRRLEFLTRHAELATYLLAIAGTDGLSAEELSATLWPGVDERRAGPRLRTLLWQVRNALGREAWRVQRRKGQISMDLTGVEVDIHREALRRAERAAAGLVGGDGVGPVHHQVVDGDRVAAAVAVDGLRPSDGHVVDGLRPSGGQVVDGGRPAASQIVDGVLPAALRADGRVRAVEPEVGGGRGGPATDQAVLLQGWDVTLPPSLTLP